MPLPMTSSTRNPRRSLLARDMHRDERGSIFVEYVVLLSLVALGCVALLVAGGVPLVRYLYAQVLILGLPFP